jgi:hypothetical protein
VEDSGEWPSFFLFTRVITFTAKCNNFGRKM